MFCIVLPLISMMWKIQQINSSHALIPAVTISYSTHDYKGPHYFFFFFFTLLYFISIWWSVSMSKLIRPKEMFTC